MIDRMREWCREFWEISFAAVVTVAAGAAVAYAGWLVVTFFSR